MRSRAWLLRKLQRRRRPRCLIVKPGQGTKNFGQIAYLFIDLVFLGAPIWWYRPAPPLWTFVENSDFHGKRVVLFNTFNSRFKSEEIDAFSRLIARKGGRLIDHVHVRRGRILNQLSGNELMERVRDVLASSAGRWPVIGAVRAAPGADL